MKNSILGKARWLREVALATSKNNGARVAHEWLKYAAMFVMLLTLGSGNVWGAEEVVYTLNYYKTGSGTASGYDGTATFSDDDMTWNVPGNQTTNPPRIGGKGGSSNNSTKTVDRTIYSTTTLEDDISKIVIEYGTKENNVTINSITVTVSKNSNFSSPVSTITSSFKASDTVWVVRPANKSWAGCYFKINYNITLKGRSNVFFQFKKADFYAETSSCEKITTAPTVTATPGDRQISLSWPNQSEASSYSVTCTGGTVGAVTGTSTKSCTISSLTNGTSYTWTVTPVGDGSTYCESGNTAASASATPNVFRTITYYDKDGQHTTSLADGTNIATALTALYGGDDPVSCDATNYEYFVGWKVGEISGTASSVTLLDDEVVNSSSPSNNYYAVWSDTDPSASGGWEAVSSLAVGDQVVLCYSTTLSNYEMSGINASNYGNMSSWDKAPNGDYLLTIENGNSSGQFSFKNGTKYLSWTSGNSLTTSETKDAASSWNVTIDGSTKVATITNANTSGSDTRYLQANVGSTRFACYKNTQSDCQLYKQTSSGTPVYITTCCTKLNAVNGSVAWTNPSEAVLTWDNVANVSSWAVICNVHGGSAAGTVGSITTNGSGKKTCTITGLACNTSYDFTITGTPSSSTYCEASQTLENKNSGKWSVSYSLSDVTKTSGPETGANVCGDFSAVFEATNSKILPAAITVQIGGVTKTAGTDYTWDQSTGALSIVSAKITGAISITITGTAPAYAFWYGEKGQSWTSIPFASVGSGEHQITGFVMPNYEYEEGLGQMYWNVAGSGITATNREFYAMSFAQTQSSCGNYDYYNDGTNKNAWIRGAAAGAKGTLRIYDYKGDNGWCAFIPDEYILKIGTSEVPFIVDGSDANVWETALTTLSTLNGGSLISTTKYRVGVGDASHHFVQVYNKCAETNISSMGRKTGAGDSWATDLTTVPAAQGKFRIWINNCTNGNWECHFVPYYQLTYDANGGGGSMAALPATPVSCEETVTNRTVTVGACTFTAPTGKEFKEWNTQADGNGTTVAQGNLELTSDVKLYAIWKDANYSVTITQSPDAGATTTGQTSTAHYNETINLTTTEPDGYRFVNWTTSDGFSITNSTSATTASFTMPAKNVTVTANFVQTHSITWMVNGASYSTGDPDVIVDHGGSISTLPTAPSAPTGCPDKVFMGWSEKNSGTTAKDDSYYDDLFKTTAPSPINSDKVFYAVFADEDDSGGSGSTNITISSKWTKKGASGGGTAGESGVILVTQDGVTLTHPRAYVNTEVRLYKDYNCDISVNSPSKITKVEFTVSDNSYNAQRLDSWAWNGEEWVSDGNYKPVYDSGSSKWNGVWENASGQTTISFGVTDQVRLSSIKVYYTSTSYDNYVTLCSSCTTPSGLAVSGITSTGGKVTWNGVSVDDGFKVLWSTSSSRPDPATGNNADVAAGTNEYTISGLTPATHYYVWVQSKCNSEWSSNSADFYTNAKITYAAGTGASGSMDPKEVTYNTNAVVDACTFEAPTGKTFNGWLASSAVTVGGSSTTSVADGATISNLTAAITLTAQWRDLNTWDITFNADNGTIAGGRLQVATEGSTFTFPNVTSTTCGTFIGWITSSSYSSATKPASFVEAGATEDISIGGSPAATTYYAVYAEATNPEPTEDYVLIENEQNDWSGDYLIVVSYDDSGTPRNRAMDGSLATLDATSNYQDVIISSKTITSNATTDGYKFTIAKVAGQPGKYSIQSAHGEYMGSNGDNTASKPNEIDQSSTLTADLYNTISYNSTESRPEILGSNANPLVLTYNKASGQTRFRYMTAVSTAIQIYKKGGGSVYTYKTSPSCTATVSTSTPASSFTYVYGNGPSESQTFQVSGSNLSANLVVTAPSNYEVSADNSSFSSSINIAPSGDGRVATTTVYIHLAAGLNVGTYSGGVITVSSTGADNDVSGTLTGSVTKATGSIAFTDFNAVDHYEAEWTGSAILVPYNYSKTGDGTLTTEKVGGRGGAVDTENKKWSLTNEGTYTLRLTLGNGTNYTGAGPVTADFVIYKADRYYDNLHGNEMILKRNDAGEDHYTIPSLSDETRQTSGSCSQTHYHFMGWVPESALSSLSDDAAYTEVMITGGGTQAASGTNYYAVWAEE